MEMNAAVIPSHRSASPVHGRTKPAVFHPMVHLLVSIMEPVRLPATPVTRYQETTVPRQRITVRQMVIPDALGSLAGCRIVSIISGRTGQKALVMESPVMQQGRHVVNAIPGTSHV